MKKDIYFLSNFRKHLYFDYLLFFRYGFKNVFRSGYFFFFIYRRIPIKYIPRKTFAHKRRKKWLSSRRRLIRRLSFCWFKGSIKKWLIFVINRRRSRNNFFFTSNYLGLSISVHKYSMRLINLIKGECFEFFIPLFSPVLQNIRYIPFSYRNRNKAKIYCIKAIDLQLLIIRKVYIGIKMKYNKVK